MALALRVNGLDADGVGLLSPDSPGFDEVASQLMGERIAHIGLQLKPMLAIVSNESPQTIVSLSIVWHMTHEGGRTTRLWGHTSFPETVCGDVISGLHPEAIRPGQRHLEAYGIVLHGYGQWDEYFDQFLGQFVDEKDASLAGAVELRIDLNAVIFADGTLVGADDGSQLTELFSAYVQAKQEWYRGIIAALDNGESVDQAFSAVRVFLDEQSREMRAGTLPRHADDPKAIWTGQAAAEAASWRRRFKDEEIPQRLRTAIRLEPFEIRRRVSS
jgi:hypothetical protein